ncbi:MAG: putative addiction module antidote protein [Rickettsiales bacterium]|nr:putative addiction module antidote protein [Rickettsiales bacterium]
MKTKFKELDFAELINTEEKQAAYLNAELKEGDPFYVKLALANIARARNMTELAKKAGVPRISLYRALSRNGNPEHATIEKIADALDMRLMVVPKNARVELRPQ